MPVIIGHTRFSLFHPNFEGWKASNGTHFDSPEEYRDFLFAEERLRPRADIFLNHTIPTLARANRSSIYRHVISYSSNLPQKYKDLLHEVSQQYDCIVLDEQRNPSDALDIASYAKELVDETGVFGTFRVDDDDVLAANFFRQAERYLKPAFAGMKVSLALGCTAIYDGGQFRMARASYQPMIAIGLMSVNRWDSSGSLIAPRITAHNKSDRFDPVVVYAGEPSYLWLRHVGQDTNVGNEAWSTSVAPIENMLSKLERIPLSVDLAELFPTIDGLGLNTVDFGEQLSGPELLASPQKFDLKEPVDNLKVTYSGEFEWKPNGDRNMLISLHLVDGSGHSIPSDSTIAGLTHSDHPSIDWFKYIGESEQKVKTQTSFELPAGVYCNSVTIMRWLEPNNRFTTDSITIHHTSTLPN